LVIDLLKIKLFSDHFVLHFKMDAYFLENEVAREKGSKLGPAVLFCHLPLKT
jgi:hypothetical protein